MKKTERINDMLMFLNNRDAFQLRDLMNEYQISKSTALRDVQSLEQLGMPIYSEKGRYGSYKILKNKMLSPIIFSLDEMYALYFAMLTLGFYQSTPFHLSVAKLNEKFENCLSPNQVKKIHRMREVLQLEGNHHHYESEFLDEILESILDENVLEILYEKKEEKKRYLIQFFRISAKFGQWYVAGREHKTNKYRVFRCDRIIHIEERLNLEKNSLEELMSTYTTSFTTDKPIPFEVEIAPEAIDIYYKENYPSMKIEMADKTVISGFYHPREESFIADYIGRFGSCVRCIKPEPLKTAIQNRMRELLKHYDSV